MPPEKLNEAALRRPEFVEGTPVVLADGQVWSLRCPVVWFVPHNANPSGFRTCIAVEPGDDFQGLLDARQGVIAGGETVTIDQIAGPELAIGRRLLEANYDLDEAQLCRVLRFSYDRDGNPEGWRIREEVMNVAMGLGPKPSPDGTDASPMPSGESPGETG